jgi:hypothetical protein
MNKISLRDSQSEEIFLKGEISHVKKNVVTSIQCHIRYSNPVQEKHIKEIREDREILFHLRRNREKIKDLTYNLSK